MRKLNIKKGDRFERLSIMGEAKPYIAPKGQRQRQFLCQCGCGNEVIVGLNNLRKGIAKSCGCLQKEIIREMGITHNRWGTPTYRSWDKMKQRCNNRNNECYKNYGGRGIKVCKEWNKFENFYKDMGDRPKNTTIDRTDNNGNYCKENCRWATWIEQANNRRNNKIIKINNQNKTLTQWCKIYNLKYGTINTRIIRGWTIEKALFTKVK
jgi:hypothetical protein